MIKLKKLRFQNIGRFVEMQEISLETFGHLVQVDGKNNNTGGSSGAGKTTVFNALDFLFGLNSIPNSQLQSRLTDEHIFVEGEFDLNGLPLIMSRSKKLKIDLNGEVTQGSSKLVEEKLDQIISIPRHMFLPMLHKKQGERGFFLRFIPSEMNSFLTDCLGLSKYKNHIITLDCTIEDLSKKIDLLVTELESNKSALKASGDAILALGLPPAKDVDQKGILELKTKTDSLRAGLESLLTVHKRDEEEFVLLNRPNLEYIAFDSTIIERYEKDLYNIRTNINELILAQKDKESVNQQLISNLKLKQAELNNKIQHGKNAKEEAIKIAAEILKIRKNTCPKCEQVWVTDNIKTEESSLLEKVKKLKEIMLIGEESFAELDSVQKELMLFNKPVSDIVSEERAALIKLEHKVLAALTEEKTKKHQHDDSQIVTNKAKQDDFDRNYKILRDLHSTAADQIRGQLDIHRRSFDAAVMKLKSYAEAEERYKKSLDKLEAQKDQYSILSVGCAQEIAKLTQQLGIAEELKKAIKSYLSCSFDEALMVISENATKMLQCIPNMENASIELNGTKENKQGAIKDEVVAILHTNGEQNIPIKTLSGGERAAVDISIDLSVLMYIEEKNNVGINLYIMDEPLHSLDSINSEQVLEMIKKNSTGKAIILVDHNPITAQLADSRIIVERNGEFSKVIS